jgi:hypothetical protein
MSNLYDVAALTVIEEQAESTIRRRRQTALVFHHIDVIGSTDSRGRQVLDRHEKRIQRKVSSRFPQNAER